MYYLQERPAVVSPPHCEVRQFAAKQVLQLLHRNAGERQLHAPLPRLSARPTPLSVCNTPQPAASVGRLCARGSCRQHRILACASPCRSATTRQSRPDRALAFSHTAAGVRHIPYRYHT